MILLFLEHIFDQVHLFTCYLGTSYHVITSIHVHINFSWGILDTAKPVYLILINEAWLISISCSDNTFIPAKPLLISCDERSSTCFSEYKKGLPSKTPMIKNLCE